MRRPEHVKNEIIQFALVALFALIAAVFFAPDAHAQNDDLVVSTSTKAGFCSDCRESQGFKLLRTTVFGEDDRVKPSARYENQTPEVQKLMEAVGEIYCTADGVDWYATGTGTVVGDGTKILTAMHTASLKDELTQLNKSATACAFVKYDYRNNSKKSYRIIKESIPSNYPEHQSKDLWIAKLNRAVIGVTPLKVKAVQPKDNQPFALIASNSDVSGFFGSQIVPGLTLNIPVQSSFSAFSNLGGHKVDTESGASGGPLVDLKDKSVFGIHLALIRYRKNNFAGELDEMNAFLWLSPAQVAEINK